MKKAYRRTRWHSIQPFGGPFHSQKTSAGPGLIEGCSRRKCVLVICSMKCTLVRFPADVTGSSMTEIVKTGNTRISN